MFDIYGVRAVEHVALGILAVAIADVVVLEIDYLSFITPAIILNFSAFFYVIEGGAPM
ncbi:hypothetical protein [Glutamicibacter arilaitensis]|uniref:hypothetical protein n=1 Tax=Glutamicibacter arilaitensis TaxID=256701 RepID=UPI003F8DC0C3